MNSENKLGTDPFFVSTGFAIPNWYLDSDSYQKWKDLLIRPEFPIKPRSEKAPEGYSWLIQGSQWGKNDDYQRLVDTLKMVQLDGGILLPFNKVRITSVSELFC